MWLVDLNYIFECDWLIKLSDNKLSNNKLSNKLSDNNLASELVENRTFLNSGYFPMQRVIWHRVLLSLIVYSSTSQKKMASNTLHYKLIFLSFKGNKIWTCSVRPVGCVTPLSVAFISFAEKVALDFCPFFSHWLRILFSLNL